MKCNECAQVSDWLESESDWERVNEEAPVAARPLLECAQCGNYQTLQ